MQQKLTLNVSSRFQTGRSASRRLRKVKRVPAILYGKHTSPEKLSVDVPEFVRLLKAVAGRAKIIELARADKPEAALAFLQEVQRDPLTDTFLHIDLQEVKADEKFEIRVPVVIVGEAYGVKTENGVLEIACHQLRIRCLPKDLPDYISVDVTELKMGETIKVNAMKPIAGVEFRELPGQPVVSCIEVAEEVVETPAATEAAAAAPAAGEAAAGAAAPAAGAAPAAAGAAAPAAGAKAAAPAAGAKAAAPAAGAKPAAKPAAPAKK